MTDGNGDGCIPPATGEVNHYAALDSLDMAA